MHKTEYYIVKFLFWLFNRMSFKGGKRAAFILYIIVAKIFRYRRKVILDNLRLVYGDNLPDNEQELLKNIYKNFVYLWMEFFQMRQLTVENINEHIRFHDRDILDNALKKGNGVILISGHFGNFEWEGGALSMLGYPIAGIAKKQSNQYVDKLIYENRTKLGSKVIYTKNAMKDGLKTLKNNGTLCLVADQDARKSGIFVNFLGQPSSTAAGPAVFKKRSQATMIFTISVRRDYGVFDVFFKEVFDSSTDDSSSEDVKTITQMHTSMLEEWVLLYPEQWFWVHKRWKTKPPPEDQPAENTNGTVKSEGVA
ncbi:MAG: lysophospholipid acyltransferase family protein [Calditrichaceae bacterium]